MTYDSDSPTVPQPSAYSSEELLKAELTYGASYGMERPAHVRPPYSAGADPGAHCHHGRGCQRCAMFDGEWTDFS